MSLDSIHGNSQYFSDFFIFFTFDKTQPHNFSTTIRELIDPIHNLPDQFFMFGIVGLNPILALATEDLEDLQLALWIR